MDNNENNNINLQPNLGSQILMDDTPNNISQPNVNTNQNMQPNLGSQILVNDTTSNMNENVQSQANVVTNSDLTQIQPSVDEDNNESIKSSDDVETIFSDVPPVVEEQQIIKKKKRKWPIVVIIILILGILSLSGYIVYDKFYVKTKTSNTTDATKTTDTKENKNTEVETSTSKALLKDVNEKVVYSDVDEKHNGVIRRIPYINIDSRYAEQVNTEIKELTKDGALQGQVKDHYLEYTVDYQYYINDEIVSVKLSWETETDQTYTKIYNINQYTGKKAANTEILKYVNINGIDLANIMVESYKKARPFDSIENNNFWKECYQKDLDTLSSGNIKALYLNNKELYVLFDLNYPAGSGIGEAILNVTGNKIILNPVTMK